jgi:4-amino-4-deoxy-L-arabinose transferase-like glycosyltransferase
VMFRFNNPDALLVLLMVAAAYATTRAIEKAGTRWLLLAGALIGFGFITKMAQALIVLPALALAYLIAAPTGFWRRIRQLLAGGAAMVVAAGWWIATVELWPTDSRPYIGGSSTNSVMELALGYNGLGRIFGNFRGGRGGAPGPGMGAPELGAGPPPGGEGFGGGGPGGFGGQPGLLRLFNEEIGGQIAWLLPAALVLLVAGLWLVRSTPLTDQTRAALVLWGGWTVVTLVVFSFAEGIFHGYYTVALAPGIAALVGIGGRELWRQRGTWPGRITLSAILAATAATAWVLLGRSPDFLPWLRWVVVAIAAVAALLVLLGRRWAIGGLVAVLLTGAIAPAAYAVQTVATARGGSMPTAGPAVQRQQGQQRQDGGGPRMMGRGPGEEEGTTDAALIALLQQAGTSWSAATTGAQSGANLALASGTNVMSIGGFTGSDPAPTLAQFQAYVAEGKVHWFVEGGGPGGGGPRGPGGPGDRRSSEITTWVKDTFASSTVGGRTVYDLTRPLH